MLFLMYPEVRPKKFPTKYEPRVFGFKVHRSAYEDVDRGGCMSLSAAGRGDADCARGEDDGLALVEMIAYLLTASPSPPPLHTTIAAKQTKRRHSGKGEA
jgi:hypothetical protein